MGQTESHDEPSDSARKIHAATPHCGVCAHVTFQDDWDRTPYCTYHQQVVEIGGEICSAFDR